MSVDIKLWIINSRYMKHCNFLETFKLVSCGINYFPFIYYHFFLTIWNYRNTFSLIFICLKTSRLSGADPGRPPPKIGNVVKPWFFTRNTPKNFAPPSARRNFFKCALPNLKSWIRPWLLPWHTLNVLMKTTRWLV